MRSPVAEDLSVAMIHLLLQLPEWKIEVPCERYAGSGFMLAMAFREDGPNDHKLIVELRNRAESPTPPAEGKET